MAGYDGAEILHGVDLLCRPHQRVAVIGPNGAGKSTLLKAVFGIAAVSDGSVSLGGESLLGLSPSAIVRKGVSYVPQLANVFASLSVQENLEMGAFAYRRGGGHRQRWVAERMEQMVQRFPVLADKLEAPAGALSGGQRQMVALARALMLEPQILLLDEPSAGLSPTMVETIFELISEIAARGGGIFLVEQNARKALEMADHAYVLANGSNAAEGEPTRLLQDEEVARLYLDSDAEAPPA